MQSTMRTQVFGGKTIGEAATNVLEELKEKANATRSVSSRDNVFYFNGWDGLGASAVLRSIAQRLTATSPAGRRALAELGFEQVIHIDCSKWESRRALQRAVAEQLELPANVMEMFDRQDEEDDFRGLAQGSRNEVQQVVREMHRCIQKMDRRFLVIFHNGSDEEIDLASCCGFPLSGFSTSKVLWTFQGRFRQKPRVKVDVAMKSAGTTDAFLTASPWLQDDADEESELWSYLVHQEAMEIATSWKINARLLSTINQHPAAQVSECFLYLMEQCCRGSHSIDYDFSIHGANYWVCDGIIIHQLHQVERGVSLDDELWVVAEALQREMQLDVDYHQFLHSSPLAKFVKSKPYWTSPTCGFTWIPAGAIPNGEMFQHYSKKLRVLKLSRCTINLQSPPFLCCHSLRFLWLDHCQGTGSNTDEKGKEEDMCQCFQRLWVLDMRSTDCGHILSAQMLDLMTQLKELNVMGAKDWDIGQLQGRLPNIRKLRVKNSIVSCSCPENDLFSGMNKMELLDFSGNNSTVYVSSMRRLSGPGATTNNSFLETVTIADGFYLYEMSFRGCTRLKNLLLRGMMWVHNIDISGTAVKTLDLTTTSIQHLDELYLLGCEKLCAITWPPKDQMRKDLSKLCIDTTQSAPTAQSRNEKDKKGTTATTSGTSVAAVPHGSRPTSEFDWHISVRDARLLKSLEQVYSDSRKIYVEVSSPTTISADGSKDQGIRSGSSHEQVNLRRHPAPAVYRDVTVDHLQQQPCEGDDDAGEIMGILPCPDVPDLPQKSCYMHIQDQTPRTELLPHQVGKQTSGTIAIPWSVSRNAKILHMHDSTSITSTPSCEYGSE